MTKVQVDDQVVDDQIVDDEVVDDDLAKIEQEPTIEEIAAEHGHKSKEDWIADGRDPKDWRSAEVFNARGEWIDEHKAQSKRIDDIEASFNTRLDNVNKIHKQQLEVQKAELLRKRGEAIALADQDTADSIQGDIDNLNSQSIDMPDDQGVLDKWNADNPWILGTEPKAAYAKQQFALYQQQGQPAKRALANVEADVARAFPAVNLDRDNQPITEKGSPPGRKRTAKKLTMADVTSEELKYRQAMPGAWKSDAEFLQAVSDSRSEL